MTEYLLGLVILIIGIVIGFKIGSVQVSKSLSKVRFAYMKKNGKFVWLKSKTVHYWHNYIELEKTNGLSENICYNRNIKEIKNERRFG